MKKFISSILLLSFFPAVTQASGLSGFGEMLYWHASEQTASSWASDLTSPKSGTLSFTPENIDFDKNLGFRVGLGYEPETHFWDTKLFWTHYETETNASTSRGLQILVPEFFSGFLSQNYFFGGSINWKIAMDALDAEASHLFQLNDSLGIRPKIGLKGVSIDQSIQANWNAVIYNATEKVDHDFFGTGPTLGLEGNWNIWNSFNLVGSADAAYLWGRWNVTDTYQRPSALFGLITPTTITTTLHQAELGTMMFDYFVGFEWLHPQKTPVSLTLGYEMQTFSNQLRLTAFQIFPTHGDLTFQGVTCRLTID